ncbi:MAG: GNAT family N-acetyltransferase [Acetobacteraceae bacterium]|jgi:GNAT superfamily N-acetyltransferase|nr:GNAT family N-acetyltransferase [Acetobacteraceae bacterium]
MRIAVRAARNEEAGTVASLVNAINSLDGGRPEVPMTAEAVRRDLLGPAPLATLLVGTVNGALRGFATGNLIYDAERGAPAMFLLDLYVAPESRRHGLGRALMAGLAAEGQRCGARCLWWGVDEGDDEARMFYDAIGARAEGQFTGMILHGPRFSKLAAEAE